MDGVRVWVAVGVWVGVEDMVGNSVWVGVADGKRVPVLLGVGASTMAANPVSVAPSEAAEPEES